MIFLDKKEGETPLEALELFRSRNELYKDVKMTYAGRLDPMASGLLIVLTGEETKNKEKYLALDKEYEFEVLFGFATDTYDILGEVTESARACLADSCVRSCLTQEELQKKIKQNMKSFTGKFIQKYPLYSSKAVRGKQLFEYARAGLEVEIPEREVNVKSLKLLKIKKINNKKLLENIEKRIAKVGGDFRQKEIIKIWKENLAVKKFKKPLNFFTASFKIKCGSGTYVRSIANNLGEKIGIPALAFSIKRTRIGRWTYSNSNTTN